MFEVVHPTRAVVHNREQQDDDEEHGAEISCQYNVSVLHQIIHQKKLPVSSILFSYQKWKWGGPVQKIMRTNLIYCQQSLQNRPGLCPSISSTSSQNLNLVWSLIMLHVDHDLFLPNRLPADSVEPEDTNNFDEDDKENWSSWPKHLERNWYIDINLLHENNKIDA